MVLSGPIRPTNEYDNCSETPRTAVVEEEHGVCVYVCVVGTV